MNDKIINSIEVVNEAVFDATMSVILETGKELTKEIVESCAAEFAIGLGFSMVPALGGAINSFRTNRAIKNLTILIEELKTSHEKIADNVSQMNEETKNKFDKIFVNSLGLAADEKQSEKIKYFTRGLENLSLNYEFNEDTAYIYFDTLSALTHLDVEILIFISSNNYLANVESEFENFFDLLEKKNITREQYRAIQSNLMKHGLIEDHYGKTLTKDVESINKLLNEFRTAIIDMQTLVEKPKTKLKSIKNKTNARVPKVQAKEKLVVSKFGRELVEFFARVNEESTNENSI